MAVLAGVETAVRLHINRGDDLNARDGNGMTPLMLAASKNKAAICDLLLSAGADPNLVDPNQLDAFALARAAGAADAMSVLGRHCPVGVEDQLLTVEVAPVTGIEPYSGIPSETEAEGSCSDEPPAIDDGEDDFDVSGWEPEEDTPPPTDDQDVADSARTVHFAISRHAAVDSAEDWGNIDVFLPERADPLPKTYDEERRREILRVVRRALREGSVPESEVLALWEGKEHTANALGGALFRYVLGDLGAETDERIDVQDVGSAWEAREDDEDLVAEAVAYLEDLGSGRNDPMNFYLKGMRGVRLLTADEEMSLGRDMEVGVVSALDALASWPAGVAFLLDFAERVRSGQYEVELVLKGNIDGEPVDEASQSEVAQLEDVPEEGEAGELALSRPAREFLEKLRVVEPLMSNAGCGGNNERMLRDALAAADFSPAFLATLVDAVREDSSEAAGQFRAGILKYAEARERMTVSNLRLVLSVVRRYQGQGLPLEDLVQEGNIGLMMAVDRYDWRRGFRFSTYATWWIRQQTSRAIANMARTIRTPVHVSGTMREIAREIKEFEQAAGRVPTPEFLAGRLSIRPKAVSALMARMEEPVALHEPDASGRAPSDELIDWSVGADPLAMADRASDVACLKRLLARLGEKKTAVIRFRYGLETGEDRTLEETGEHFGVTRERIRQIVASTLTKLAQAAKSESIPVYGGESAASNGGGHGSREEVIDDGPPVPMKRGRPRKSPGLRHATVAPAPHMNAPVTAGMDKIIQKAIAAGGSVLDGRATGGPVVIRLGRRNQQMRVLIRVLLKFGFRQYAEGEFRK